MPTNGKVDCPRGYNLKFRPTREADVSYQGRRLSIHLLPNAFGDGWRDTFPLVSIMCSDACTNSIVSCQELLARWQQCALTDTIKHLLALCIHQWRSSLSYTHLEQETKQVSDPQTTSLQYRSLAPKIKCTSTASLKHRIIVLQVLNQCCGLFIVSMLHASAQLKCCSCTVCATSKYFMKLVLLFSLVKRIPILHYGVHN